MDVAIQLKSVTKTFGRTAAVKDLDLAVPYGGLYGFIGPNGAGKTTTIRLILSIFFPDSGEISVLGHASAFEARNRIGYLPEERGVYRKMRVGAFVRYIAGLKRMKEPNLDKMIRASLERVGLGGTEHKRCEELSKGMLQKVQVVAAVIHKPDLLILDEPFSGLDPVSTRLLRDLVLRENRRGATILFSTHVMPQAEEICQHVIMIHRGRKVLDEPLASIRSRYDPRIIEFDPLNPGEDLGPVAHLPGVERVEPGEAGYKIHLVQGTAPADAMRRIMEISTPARLELSRPRLEDIFIELVSTAEYSPEDRKQLREGLKNAGDPEAAA